MTDKEKEALENFLNENQRKWTLLYRANQSEFRSDTFHQVCYTSSPTLTIIKANNGNIFGGYTSQNWQCEYNGYTYGYDMNSINVFNYVSYLNQNQFKQDQSAFIFSLKNILNKPVKACVEPDSSWAIYCSSNNGPCFGQELYISFGNDNMQGFSSTLRYYSKKNIDENFLHIPFAGSNFF